MMMNTAINILIINTCFFSFIFSSLTMLPLIKSRVNVDEEVNTSEDNVDIEADNTRITTSAIKKSEVTAFSSIVGTIESKSFVLDTNNLPNPPKK